MPDPFKGFPKPAFAFLRELEAEQTRAWFEANRDRYETSVLGPMRALVSALGPELARRDIPLQSDPKRAIFRIHRDVRFSRDKRPYKTHIGAALTRSGEKMSPGVLYIHIDPKGCFAACGFYRPEPDALGAMRDAIAGDPAKFRHLISDLASRGLVLSPDEDALKRLPRRFETVTDPDVTDALRRRSFILRQKLTQAEVGRPDLVATVAGFAEAALPLLTFGWSALG